MHLTKQSNTMYSEILTLIQTTDDINLLESELVILKAAIYDTKQDFSQKLNSKVRKHVAELISKELQSSGLSNKDYIEGLEKELAKMETVQLTLAYEPDAQSFATIYQWFVDNVGESIVLDIYTNPNILGGIQVSYKGKYFDGSLVSKVNKLSRSVSKQPVKEL